MEMDLGAAATMKTKQKKEKLVDQDLPFDPEVITAGADGGEAGEETTAVAVKETTAVVPAQESDVSSGYDPNLILPFLKITQKQTEYDDISEEEYKFGDLVLDKRLVLPQPVLAYVVGVKEYFEEFIDFEEDGIPRRSDNEQALRDMLGPEGLAKTKKWGPYYPCAQIVMLMKKPDGISDDHADLFPFELEDGEYGFCQFIASRSSHVMWKLMHTTEKLTWRGNLQKGGFLIGTHRKKSANPYFIPTVKVAKGDTPADVLDAMGVVTG